MTLKSYHLYPLIDPTAYDDEFGAGFDHVIFDTHEDLPEQMYLADAWIVNREGQVHPGYNELAIPVRRDDLDLDRAVAFDGDFPSPAGLSKGWGVPRGQ